MIMMTAPRRNRHLAATIVFAIVSQVGCNGTSSNTASQSESASKAPVVQTDLQRNQGRWIATFAILSGTPFPSAVTDSISLDLSGDRYEVMVGDKPDKGTFNTDIEHSPNRMTIIGTDGPNAGKTFLAICDFPTEDEMRICCDLSNREYPSDFESTKENGFFLAKYSRRK